MAAGRVSKAAAPEEEEEEDGDDDRQFVWDPKKGCLVDAVLAKPAKPAAKQVSDSAPASETKSSAPVLSAAAKAEAAYLASMELAEAKEAPATAEAREGGEDETGKAAQVSGEGAAEGAADADAGAGEADGDGDAEGSSDEAASDSSEGGDQTAVDADTESKLRFLTEASTPELIMQAVAVGGALASSVVDKWVVDQATQLSFRYDSQAKKMHCWNASQAYMYLWKGRGKLEFLWTPGQGRAVGPDAPAPPGEPAAVSESSAPDADGGGDKVMSEAAAEAASADSAHAVALATLWVTVLPPSVLDPAGLASEGLVTEDVKVPAKALGKIIGKGGASIQEIETITGATLTVKPPGEEDVKDGSTAIVLEGTRDQVSAAKLALEQKLVIAIGSKKAESLRKHQNSELLEQKRKETGADAAIGGVDGLSSFAEKWKLRAVIVRKLRKLDAMLQRYLVRHFKPGRAKPENAVRAFVTMLLMHPQPWRFEALRDDGELDGDVCETAPIGLGGAVVGLQRSATDEILGEVELQDDGDAPQRIELEVDGSLGDAATRVYGDVRPNHCRLFGLGGNFYAMALESQIGTVVDGKKYRQQDGPVPIRDGSVLDVGKYLILCEVGTAAGLQDRRRRILGGESVWKILKGASKEGATRENPAEVATQRADAGVEEVEDDAETRAEDGGDDVVTNEGAREEDGADEADDGDESSDEAVEGEAKRRKTAHGNEEEQGAANGVGKVSSEAESAADTA